MQRLEPPTTLPKLFMKVVIVGGRGRTALLLEGLLARAGHDVVGVVRRASQVEEVRAVGASAVVLDVESSDAVTLAELLCGADAVVYAAGAGYGSSTKRKLAVDRDGAILVADAAELAGVRRFVLISSMGTDRVDPLLPDPFQIYLRVKGEADANVRSRNLDWTIVRPSGLSDAPGTGFVRIASELSGGIIPRADVAELLAHVLTARVGVRKQFDVTSGSTPIAAVTLS
jgi:uncharacterized protein YbjT (DUF2867 family)